MTTCTYCTQPATTTIIAIPAEVCLVHALEFWTGLLDYTRGRSGACVKDERECGCALCEELSADRLRHCGIASVGPSPGDHENFPIRLAS